MRGVTLASVLCLAFVSSSGCQDSGSECEDISLPDADGVFRVIALHCEDFGPGYRYEYETVEFRAAGVAYVARSYHNDYSEVHFLAKEVDGERVRLTPEDVESESFRQAVDYFRSHGKTQVNYLSSQQEGYVSVPP